MGGNIRTTNSLTVRDSTKKVRSAGIPRFATLFLFFPSPLPLTVCESLLDRLGLFANGRTFEAENWFRLFHARVPQTNDAVWPSFSVQELQDSAIRGEGERQHAEEIEHLMRQRNDNILSDDMSND